MKRHYCYKIVVQTGEFAGHWYIGKRSCYGPIENDPYMGSGVKITVINETEYCTKEILSVWKSSAEAYDEEARLVTTETLRNPLCLNMQTGGGRDSNDTTKRSSKYKDAWSTMFYDEFGYLERKHAIVATQLALNPNLKHDDVEIPLNEFRAIKRACKKQDSYADGVVLIETRTCERTEDVIPEQIKIKPKTKRVTKPIQKVIPDNYVLTKIKKSANCGYTYIKVDKIRVVKVKTVVLGNDVYYIKP